MWIFRHIEGSRFRSYGVQREVRANNPVVQQQLFDQLQGTVVGQVCRWRQQEEESLQ